MGKNFERKIKSMKKCANADKEEKVMVKEMLNDIHNHFNNDDDYYTNRHLIGYKYLFRGVIVKDWVICNYNSVDFHLCNKVLIKNCVKYHHD